MNHNVNLLSIYNNLKVYEVDLQHNYISFEDGESVTCFSWEGSADFFTDGNGVGESWVDFNHDIEVTCINEEDTKYDEDFVIEHIAQELYNAEYAD